MSRVYTYDPAEVNLFVSGFHIRGFEQGSFVEVERDQPVWSDASGVDGESARWLNLNPFATLTLTLRASSRSNLTLAALREVDEVTQRLPFSVALQEPTGNAVSAQGWIRSDPPLGFSGAGPGARVWSIRMTKTLFLNLGAS